MLLFWLVAAALFVCRSAPEAVVVDEVAVVDRNDPQGFANAEEASWYDADPSRRQQIDALPLPKGDACEVTFDQEQNVFVIGGIPVFFPFGDAMHNEDVGSLGRIMNVRRGKYLFVGFGDQLDSRLSACGSGPEVRADTLWRLDCSRRPLRPEVFFRPSPEDHEWIDFGSAVAAPSGDALYVVRGDGIARFSLKDKSLRPLLAAPGCGVMDPLMQYEEGCSTVLLPSRVTSDGFEVTVAVPEPNCTATSHDETNYIVDLASAAVRAEPHAWRRVLRIGAFAVAGDTWWLGADNLSGNANTGYVWRSRDEGQTWDPIRVTATGAYGDPSIIYGIAAILVDQRDPQRVLVMSDNLTLSDHIGAGDLFVTRDGGRRWRRLPLEEGEPLGAVWSDGSLDHLYLTRPPGGFPDEQATFESRDGGETWQPSQAKAPKGGLILPKDHALSPLGLWRTAPERSLVFPPPNLMQPMSIHGHPIEPKPRAAISWDEWDRGAAANARGLELIKNKQPEAAIAAYREAWAINPNNAYARYNAACAYAGMGRTADAMALIEALHARRGHRERALLAAAATDADLVSLRALPRFRVLTTAFAPWSAWDVSAFDYEQNAGSLWLPSGVVSDRHERMCLWVENIDVEERPLVLERFDCRSGVKEGKLRGSAKTIYGVLDDLGMVPWEQVAGDEPAPKIAAWATRNGPRVGEDTEVSALQFQSPSGKRIAGRFTHEDDAGNTVTKLVFGAWPR